MKNTLQVLVQYNITISVLAYPAALMEKEEQAQLRK